MSLITRSVLIFTILSGALVGQPLTAQQTMLDASNGQILARPRVHDPNERGTISVQELQDPPSNRGMRMLDKAKQLIARGEIARGMEQLRAAQRETSVEAYALGMQATEHFKRGDLDTAMLELETAVALRPGIAVNQSNLAYMLGVKRRNEEALAHAKAALRLDPAHCKTRYVMAQILLQMGRTEEAAFPLRKAAEEIPEARALLSRVMQ